jgi:hypothetical protein
MPTGASPSVSSGVGQHRKLLTHQPHPLKSLDQLAVTTACHRGQEICSQGRPADYWMFYRLEDFTMEAIAELVSRLAPCPCTASGKESIIPATCLQIHGLQDVRVLSATRPRPLGKVHLGGPLGWGA